MKHKLFKAFIVPAASFLFVFVHFASANTFSRQFDGNGAYVNIGNHAHITGSVCQDPFTVEFWYRSASSTAQQALFSDRDTRLDPFAPGYEINIVPQLGQFEWSLYNHNHHQSIFVTSSMVVDGSWHHVAFVKLVGNPPPYNLYIDGVPTSFTFKVNATFDSPCESSSSLLIGSRFASETPALSTWGKLDEVRFWNTSRTAQEIAANFNREISSTSSLIAYYKFNNDDTDSSGHGFNGTASASGTLSFSADVPFGGGAPMMVKPTVGGKIVQLFSTSTDISVRHLGIDIDHTISSTTVRAVADGRVIRVVTSTDPSLPAWGEWVWIFNGDTTKINGATTSKISTLYLHMDNINPLLTPGGVIPQGTALGLVDKTGVTSNSAAHLHFAVRQGDVAVGTSNPSSSTTPLAPLDPLQFVSYALSPRYFHVTARSPVDLVLTDPDGLIVSKQINELGSESEYSDVKFIADNSTASRDEGLTDYDSIEVDAGKDGDYFITVTPEASALPTDTYSLFLSTPSTTLTLVKNIPIRDIPEQPYIIRSSLSGVKKIIPVQLSIKPESLNLSSQGDFTAFIKISKGFGSTIQSINTGTLMISGAPVVRTTIDSGTDTLIAKFKKQTLINVLSGDHVTLTLRGQLLDGTTIEGSDTISIIRHDFITGLSLLLADLSKILMQLSALLQARMQ